MLIVRQRRNESQHCGKNEEGSCHRVRRDHCGELFFDAGAPGERQTVLSLLSHFLVAVGKMLVAPVVASSVS